MSAPIEPDLPNRDQGIPAADPGAGAPDTAEGFGIGGEQPDTAEGAADQQAGEQQREAAEPERTPFHTPDPDEVGPAR
ncbi:hypothetical protein [Modestobacter roseus]|uniref:Uncharacterized protein n=1 Tax=Modestobacter roseus TaxID=1181884 RepID=A0A562IUR4_9ACTN|nr:hypothetical protein [Modestobacter roseus]TWH74761.1 hypothetical protein JD78_03306 [Modestobacter roseus]